MNTINKQYINKKPHKKYYETYIRVIRNNIIKETSIKYHHKKIVSRYNQTLYQGIINTNNIKQYQTTSNYKQQKQQKIAR